MEKLHTKAGRAQEGRAAWQGVDDRTASASRVPEDQVGWESLDGWEDEGGREDWERWQSLDGDASPTLAKTPRVPRQALDELYALRVRLDRARELRRVLEGQGVAARELEGETAALETAVERLEPLAEPSGGFLIFLQCRLSP